MKSFASGRVGEWIDRLRSAGVPCSLVRTFREVVDDPQCAAREMFPAMDHPVAGLHPVTGPLVKLSATPGSPSLPAPLLGQHTRSALKELLALDDSVLDDLAEGGVVFDWGVPAESRSVP